MHIKIANLDEYIEKTNNLIADGSYTFRGQCFSKWGLAPGIIRRIKNTYPGINEVTESGLLFSLSLDATIDLLRSARASNHFKKEECDLNILAMLQHYGAATPLLDFTHDPFVALYFACQPYEKDGESSDGKVFSINYPNQVRSHNSPMIQVTNPNEIKIEYDLLPQKHRGIWYWNSPENLPCKRNKKQKSVFVFGWDLYWEYYSNSLIKELNTIEIPSVSKKEILKKLAGEYDISEQTIFPDIHGFAQSYSHDKIIQNFSSEEFYQKGEEYFWDGSFDWAAQYYKMAFTKNSEFIDARFLCAIALYWHDGNQSDALEVIEDSIKECGEKWELLLCKAIIHQEIKSVWKTDFEKAEKIAYSENDVSKFKLFINKYGSLLLEID